LKDQVYFYPEIRIFPSKSEKENGKFATLTQAWGYGLPLDKVKRIMKKYYRLKDVYFE